MTKPRRTVLPLPEPRGLAREEAAAYVGISVGTFNGMVSDGTMPQPKVIGARLVWDRLALDRAFAALPDAQARAREEQEDERWQCAV
jgi:excisionase family DNA binding protein